MKNYYQIDDENNAVHKLWRDVQRDIFDWAIKESGFNNVTDIPRFGCPAQVILLGLLVMADWIASNDSYFPLIDVENDGVLNKASREKGYYSWKKTEFWKPREIQDNISEIYQKRFGFEPREIQEALSRVIANAKEPGICILEAPMGIGKTEAALIAAEQMAYKMGCNGVFFGLPTQATSNGIFLRVFDWIKKIDKDETVNLRLSHGKAYLNDTFLKLADSMNIDEETAVMVNQWFEGKKKAVLDEFVVGTVDQLLMLSLKQKYLALRHLGFSKKVVIIDEVHAYDAYMNQYLLQALQWLGAYKVPVILLSATLPIVARKNLLRYYMKGWNRLNIKMSEAINSVKYPLITYNDGCEMKFYDNFTNEHKKHIDVIKVFDAGVDSIVRLAEKLLINGGVLGIVLNTVKRAQQTGKILSEHFGEDVVEILHSAFIASDRVNKETQLKDMIGKDGKRPKLKIIVGTQVMEQSLDIDFDVMISDLAPMDLLLQRAGRLHRHMIERPHGLEKAQLYVIGCNENMEFEEGASYIYGNYLLLRTQYFLSDEINIPADISKLVQAVYGTENIIIDKVLTDKYRRFEEEHKSKIKAKENLAKNYRIGEPFSGERGGDFPDLVGWLKNPIPSDSDERAYARVRDGEETIEVVALQKLEEGYGVLGGDEDLSERIEEPDVVKLITEQTINLPNLFSKEYNIDDTIKNLEIYNSKHLSSWRDSIWLSGALGILFDENNEFQIGEYTLIYDRRLGIMVERK